MARKNPDRFKVTKLDAARRQIETAITLWFEDGDPVAIHTLTAAGHQICHAITKNRGEKVSVLFNFDWLAPEYHARYKQFILKAENFFKHASKDPNPGAELDFNFDLTEVYLFDACRLYCHVNGMKTPLMMAFEFRFYLGHPTLTPKDYAEMFTEPLWVEMSGFSKVQFRDAFLQYAARVQT